jgi:DNA-binding CsgD family transcriptional regulator/pimeloyl-ACP methyl ester carboxylesterase
MEQQIEYCTAADGVRIACASYGGDGPPLLVLPDIVGQEHLWNHANGRALLRELGRGRRLITYDARGTGSSDRRAPLASLRDLMSDVAAVVEHLKLERMALFSLGGIASPLALFYAWQYSSRVSAVAVWGALIRKKRVEDAHIETFGRMWAFNARAMATLYFPSGPLELQRWFAEGLAKAEFEGTVRKVMEQEWDLTDLLSEITTPVLVLQRDGVKSVDPRLGKEAARLLTNARLLMLEGDADHPIHDCRQYVEALDSFFHEHAPGVSTPNAMPVGNQGGAKLTARETEVLSLLAAGQTAREIATVLGISLSTAQRHITNIYAKIGARGRVDAVTYALTRRLARRRDG